MQNPLQKTLFSQVTSSFDTVRTNSKLLTALGKYSYCILGGAVRAWMRGETPRDIDIAIEAPAEALKEIIESQDRLKVDTNKFGSYKITENGIIFDIWLVQETWALKHQAEFFKNRPEMMKDYTGCFHFYSLISLASFNVDCVGLIVKPDHTGAIQYYLFDNGFLNLKTLEVNYWENLNPQYNALRGLKIITKLALLPGESFKKYVREYLTKETKFYEMAYQKCYGEPLNVALLDQIRASGPLPLIPKVEPEIKPPSTSWTFV